MACDPYGLRSPFLSVRDSRHWSMLLVLLGCLGSMVSYHCLGRHFLCRAWLVCWRPSGYSPKLSVLQFQFPACGDIGRRPAATLFSNRETKSTSSCPSCFDSGSEVPDYRLKCQQEPSGLLGHQVIRCLWLALCGLESDLFILT